MAQHLLTICMFLFLLAKIGRVWFWWRLPGRLGLLSTGTWRVCSWMPRRWRWFRKSRRLLCFRRVGGCGGRRHCCHNLCTLRRTNGTRGCHFEWRSSNGHGRNFGSSRRYPPDCGWTKWWSSKCLPIGFVPGKTKRLFISLIFSHICLKIRFLRLLATYLNRVNVTKTGKFSFFVWFSALLIVTHPFWWYQLVSSHSTHQIFSIDLGLWFIIVSPDYFNKPFSCQTSFFYCTSFYHVNSIYGLSPPTLYIPNQPTTTIKLLRLLQWLFRRFVLLATQPRWRSSWLCGWFGFHYRLLRGWKVSSLDWRRCHVCAHFGGDHRRDPCRNRGLVLNMMNEVIPLESLSQPFEGGSVLFSTLVVMCFTRIQNKKWALLYYTGWFNRFVGFKKRRAMWITVIFRDCAGFSSFNSLWIILIWSWCGNRQCMGTNDLFISSSQNFHQTHLLLNCNQYEVIQLVPGSQEVSELHVHRAALKLGVTTLYR